ncbi:hypothetical protein HDU85_002935 [Gaertneriomyces sp. JEL0708]|nr:hypothetical protein HDU85_002935 [Gaertneriomyces sp. JEL0708]
MSSAPPSQQEILRSAGQSSVSTFLSSLVFNGFLGLLFFSSFCIARKHVPSIYMPKTYLVPERLRTVSKSGLELLKSCISWSEEECIQKAGYDAFAMIYYLRTLWRYFGYSIVVAIVTLFPLHITGGQNLKGLSILTLANIRADQTRRLWAHLIVSWIFSIGCVLTIFKLLKKAAYLRHSFMLSEQQRTSVSGYSLLIRDIPKNLRDPAKLQALFDRVQPGCVHAVMVLKKSRRLDHYADAKRKGRDHLEKTLVRYLKDIVGAKRGHRRGSVTPDKHTTNHGDSVHQEMSAISETANMRAASEAGSVHSVQSAQPALGVILPLYSQQNVVEEAPGTLFPGISDKTLNNTEHCIAIPEEGANVKNKVGRPTSKSFIFFGTEWDQISHDVKVLARYSRKLKEQRQRMIATRNGRVQGVAFIIFTDIFSPHVAALANIHSAPGVMADRYAGVSEKDIIWNNLDVPFYERRSKAIMATVITLAMTVAWASITTILSSMATLDKLIYYAPFLKFFNNFTPAVKGFIQGVVPTVAVKLVFLLVPIVMRALSRFAGYPLKTSIELRLLVFHYVFLVFNILLVITISGSVFTALRNLVEYPGRILNILATSIPTVSNFFVNYVMLLSISGPSSELLQLGNLIIKPLGKKYFAKTPRKIKRRCKPEKFRPGTILSQHSFVATVGLTYCTIAPLVLVFVVLYFLLWRMAYGYQFQYVYNHLSDTGGQYLHVAARQLFVGIYLHQLVLLGLFILKEAFPQAIIVVCGMVFVGLCHHHASLYNPLMRAVPAKAVLKYEARMSQDNSSTGSLFSKDRDGSRQLSSPQVSETELWHGPRAAIVRMITTIKQYITRLVARKEPTTAEGRIERADTQNNSTLRMSVDTLDNHGDVVSDSESDSGMVSDSDENAIPENSGLLSRSPRRYAGPSDFVERLSPPSGRSAPLKVWIPGDQYGIAVELQREIEQAVGDGVVVVTEGATIDTKGRVIIQLRS